MNKNALKETIVETIESVINSVTSMSESEFKNRILCGKTYEIKFGKGRKIFVNTIVIPEEGIKDYFENKIENINTTSKDTIELITLITVIYKEGRQEKRKILTNIPEELKKLITTALQDRTDKRIIFT